MNPKEVIGDYVLQVATLQEQQQGLLKIFGELKAGTLTLDEIEIGPGRIDINRKPKEPDGKPTENDKDDSKEPDGADTDGSPDSDQ